MVLFIVVLLYWILDKSGSHENAYPRLSRAMVYLLSCTRTFNCSNAQKHIGYSPIVSLEVSRFIFNFFLHFFLGLFFSSICPVLLFNLFLLWSFSFLQMNIVIFLLDFLEVTYSTFFFQKLRSSLKLVSFIMFKYSSFLKAMQFSDKHLELVISSNLIWLTWSDANLYLCTWSWFKRIRILFWNRRY